MFALAGAAHTRVAAMAIAATLKRLMAAKLDAVASREGTRDQRPNHLSIAGDNARRTVGR